MQAIAVVPVILDVKGVVVPVLIHVPRLAKGVVRLPVKVVARTLVGECLLLYGAVNIWAYETAPYNGFLMVNTLKLKYGNKRKYIALERWWRKKHNFYSYERLSTCLQILLSCREKRKRKNAFSNCKAND